MSASATGAPAVGVPGSDELGLVDGKPARSRPCRPSGADGVGVGGAGAGGCLPYCVARRLPAKRSHRLVLFGGLGAVFVSAVVLLILWAAGVFAPAVAPRNVIMFITDGMGPASVTMARECKSRNGEPLAQEEFLVGSTRTYSSNSLVTDSAAGATAYACALKTYNGAIGVDPSRKPCGTVLEAARMQRGMRTGLVVTSRVTHATPAAFSAHAVDRDMEELIAEQQIDLGVDVILGGGMDSFVGRRDGRDLMKAARDRGYTTVDTLAGFKDIDGESAESLPLLGLFALSHLDYEIDRDPLQQPSLAEMVTKALELLQHPIPPSEQVAKGEDLNEGGFFLLVEGSRIDMAGHLNDAAGEVHDVLAYEAAFKVALEWAEEHGDTLVISSSDHETGGLTLGRNPPAGPSGVIPYPQYNWSTAIVNRCTRSSEAMATSVLHNATLCCRPPPQSTVPLADNATIEAALRRVVSGGTGIPEAEITAGESQSMLAGALRAWQRGGDASTLARAISPLVSTRANIGWTTYGHTGVDVPLYAHFPKLTPLMTQRNGAIDTFSGVQNNIDVGDALAQALGVDLEEQTFLDEGIAVSPTSL